MQESPGISRNWKMFVVESVKKSWTLGRRSVDGNVLDKLLLPIEILVDTPLPKGRVLGVHRHDPTKPKKPPRIVV